MVDGFRHQRFDLAFRGKIGGMKYRLTAATDKVGGELLAAFLCNIGQDEPRTMCRQHAARPVSDAASSTGDNDDLIFQQTGHFKS